MAENKNWGIHRAPVLDDEVCECGHTGKQHMGITIMTYPSCDDQWCEATNDDGKKCQCVIHNH